MIQNSQKYINGQHFKKCYTALGIRKMKILRFYLIPLLMFIWKINDINAGEDGGKSNLGLLLIEG